MDAPCATLYMTLAFGLRFWTSASVCKHTRACTSVWTLCWIYSMCCFPQREEVGGTDLLPFLPPGEFPRRELGKVKTGSTSKYGGIPRKPVWTTRTHLHLLNHLWHGLQCLHCQFRHHDVYDATVQPHCVFGGRGPIWCRQGEYLRGKRAGYMLDSPCGFTLETMHRKFRCRV